MNNAKKDFKKIAIIAVVAVLVVAAFMLFISMDKSPVTTQTTQDDDFEESAPQVADTTPKISFEKYISITDERYSERLVLTGYIKEEQVNDAKVRYIVDDSNNKIKIGFGYYSTRDYNAINVSAQPATQKYEISGLLRYAYGGLIIESDGIRII